MGGAKKLTVGISPEMYADLAELKKSEKYSTVPWSELYRAVMANGIKQELKKGKK